MLWYSSVGYLLQYSVHTVCYRIQHRIQYSTVQHRIQYSRVQHKIRYSTVQHKIQYSSPRDGRTIALSLFHTLHGTARHCTALHGTALHCSLYYTALHYTVRWTVLHYSLSCTTLHCTVLHCLHHCTSLHCTLHCTTLYSILYYNALHSALYCTVLCIILACTEQVSGVIGPSMSVIECCSACSALVTTIQYSLYWLGRYGSNHGLWFWSPSQTVETVSSPQDSFRLSRQSHTALHWQGKCSRLHTVKTTAAYNCKLLQTCLFLSLQLDD